MGTRGCPPDDLDAQLASRGRRILTNGKINGAGDGTDESCISFDDLNAANVSGTFTFTNNQCTQTEANGVDVENWGATLSDVNISNNQFTDTGDVATPGSAVVFNSNSTTSANGVLTKASLNNNTITDFRAGAGFVLQANSDLGGSNRAPPKGVALRRATTLALPWRYRHAGCR